MSGFAGTWPLVRLALRRDRLMICATVIGLVTLIVASAAATIDLYSDMLVQATLLTLQSPAIVAMYGPLANPSDPDSLAIFKSFLLGGIGLALLISAVVRRHTRTEEESGRTELVGAAVVGRHAPLAAAVIVGTGIGLVTGPAAAAGLIAVGLGARGAWAFGLAWFMIGLCATAITAVAAQLTATARGCGAWALGALGVAYGLRAIGDTTGGTWQYLTWLSPFGWAEQMEPYGGNRFWVSLVPLAGSAVLLLVAGLLVARRDLGSGIVPARSGPAHGSRLLSSPLSLAWRLDRSTLIGWLVAFATLGLILGWVSESVSSMVANSGVQNLLRQLGGNATTVTDTFLAAELKFLAVGAAAYGISVALRLWTDESRGYGEVVLSTQASRRSVLTAHAVVAVAGSAALMVVATLAIAVGYGRQADGFVAAVGHLLPSALATVPAIWVCVGLALLLVGSTPRLAALAWVALAAFVVVGEFGAVLKLPSAVIGLSPFQHGEVLPGATAHILPLLLLLVVAAVLAAAGELAYERRDLH